MNTMKCWKWTRNDHKTSNDTLWGEGVEHSVPEWTGKLCTDGVIHAYQDPRLAVLIGLPHGYNPDNRLLWEAEAGGRLVVAPDKIGCETLRTIRQVESPVIAVDQWVEIAIRCAMVILPDHEWAQTWRAWAERWLSGEDRNYKSATATASDTYSSAPFDNDARRAAFHAAAAADFATNTTYSAIHAPAAAANAAYAAAYAADYAAHANRDLDIVTIIHQVCGKETKE